MANFREFFPHLLKHEGGFVNHPSDPGGATNKGVTMRTFQMYAPSLLGIEATLENLKRLTDDQAAAIYKKMYWDKVRGDDIELQELANIVFDFYVNAGGNASKLLQRVLRDMGQNISVDGAIGPGTMNALTSLDQREAYQRFKQGRIQYYHNLVNRKPSLKVFLKGWMNRVNTFPDLLSVEYGLFDAEDTATDALSSVSKKLADMLSHAIDDLTSLEVSTYTTDDLNSAAKGYDPQAKSFGDAASLRAYTRIELDGDMVNLVPGQPQTEGEPKTGTAIDEQLWRIHQEMVSQSLGNRMNFVKSLSELAGSLLNIRK